MASLPFELLYGLYLGVLTGFVPALIAWSLGLTFRYFTGITVPGLAVVGLGVAIAGLNGGLLALADPAVTLSDNQVRLTVALLVVLMATLSAHSVGDRMGANLPRKLSLRELTARTLSTDVVELVGGRGQVRVTVVGDVADVEGYPPLPADLHDRIQDGEWTFPADVPLPELETRIEDRLRTEFDLSEVDVRLDERARASVAAAPPTGGLSKRLDPGQRAVSTTALVPTGTARADEVTVLADGAKFAATVLGVVDDGPSDAAGERADDAGSTPATDGGTDVAPAEAVPTAVGGEARLTLAVRRQDAGRLLTAERVSVFVRSQGVRREFELVTLLRRAGKRFRRVAVREGGMLDGVTLGEADVRDEHGVVVLAVRHDDKWGIVPRGSRRIEAGDTLVVAGAPSDLTAFSGVVA